MWIYTLLKIGRHGLDLYVTNVKNGLTRLHNFYGENKAKRTLGGGCHPNAPPRGGGIANQCTLVGRCKSNAPLNKLRTTPNTPLLADGGCGGGRCASAGVVDDEGGGVDLVVAAAGLRWHGLVRGLPKLKFEKDHMCSACAMGKSKKKSHTPKSEDTNQEKLYLLHMDLCGPMRVASVNGKKYILVIVDDYSRFTWVKFLRSKDEAPDFIIKFLKMIQVRLKVPVRRIRTDNGTEFVNQTLREYYEKVGISHETSVARSPQQNGVVERRNRTLIEAARTMLIYAKAPLFLWAEAVATACYTQNRSIVRLRHGKTPYELLHEKHPNLSFLHVFGALCYPINDSENLDFDELTAMASEHSSLGPALHEMTPATISSGLVPNPPPSTPFVPPSRTDWDILFQPLFDELLTPLPSVDHPAPKLLL
ncbi:retrovirus-related pol polyprotein from transposon TNT 1-94 [Tanacetum coccineum]|uniref:Retrovirus-related pol polyprotein from transposon TNT 1-94 n=1 Tax=Tanacetum coccineum TaxID=301880 RepID=A0ABQ5GQ42_9ASTR